MRKQTNILSKKALVSFVSKNPKLKEWIFYGQAFSVLAINTVLPTQVFTSENSVEDPFENRTVSIEAESLIPEKRPVRLPTLNFVLNQKYSFFHPGLDLDGETGDPLFPIAKGVVIATENSRFAYGKAVYVDHGSGYTSLYAHLSQIEVAEGQFVDVDTEIGLMGSTGHSTGSHLHLEIRKNGLAINPLSVLPKN